MWLYIYLYYIYIHILLLAYPRIFANIVMRIKNLAYINTNGKLL